MLIAFEGLDGSGKTTQARLLFEKLSQSYSCILTKEPTDGPIGLFARDNMKSSTNKDTMENTLLMEAFFIADRIDHVNSVIKPGLESGKVVITDRYVLSTIAYGGVVGIDTVWLAELNKSFPTPDITFLMDIDTQAAMERLKMPDDIVGFVELRSTWARHGLSMPPTIIDAGFEGNVTLEVVNNAPYGIKLRPMQGFAHIIFVKTSNRVRKPYAGKYLNQSGIRIPKKV